MDRWGLGGGGPGLEQIFQAAIVAVQDFIIEETKPNIALAPQAYKRASLKRDGVDLESAILRVRQVGLEKAGDLQLQELDHLPLQLICVDAWPSSPDQPDRTG